MSVNAYGSREDADVRHPQRAAKATLAVGSIALTAAILVAYSTPPAGYEVSLYAATPRAFWAGVAIAVACAFGCAALARDRRLAGAGLALGCLAVLAIVGLPLLRGYRFYGAGDALSHLGWASQVLDGSFFLPALLYPGLHGLAVLVRVVTGAALTRSMLLVVFLFAAVFLAFVPLVVRSIAGSAAATAFGAASALFFLPVNNVSVHLNPHPSTMAILFVPVALYALVGALGERPTGRFGVGPYRALLALSSVALVLVHPQQAANFLLVLLALSVITFVDGRWFRPLHDLAPVYGQTAFLAVVLAGWSLAHERIVRFVAGAATSLLTGSGAATVTQRTGSLSSIGASVVEVFVKLFAANVVFLALAAVIVLVVLVGRPELPDRERGTVFALGIGLVPAGLLMLVYLGGGVQSMAFRQLGFLMAVVTVLGAVALCWLLTATWHSGVTGTRAVTAFVTVGLALLLVLSLASLFPSPYIYKPSEHVTDQQFTGYQETFASRDPGVDILGVRSPPIRYEDAIQGTGDLVLAPAETEGIVSNDVLDGGLADTYSEPKYVVVTQTDVQREVVAYHQIRYSRRALTTVGTRPGVDHVQSNGEFDLYYVAAG